MTRNNIELQVQNPDLIMPTYTTKLWGELILGLVAIMSLSTPKDWWLTGDKSNIWFYIFMPIIDSVGTAVVMFLVARLLWQLPKFLDFLAVTMGTAIVMQSMEIITKLIHYKVWEYPVHN
jgi:hypothetical protein